MSTTKTRSTTKRRGAIGRRFRPVLFTLAGLALFGSAILGLGQAQPPAETKAADDKPAEPKTPDEKPAGSANVEKPTPKGLDLLQPDSEAIKTLLFEAMANNPDIQVGREEFAEAELEMVRVRLDVARKVVALSEELKMKQAEVDYAVRLLKDKVVSPNEVELQKSKLAMLTADLSYLLGVRAAGGADGEQEDLAKLPVAEMLARAMKGNPDLQLATAKLGGPRTQTRRTRLDVARKVVTLHATIQKRRIVVSQWRKFLEKSPESTPEYEVAEALANLTEAEAELDYLLGRSPLDQPKEK